MRSASRVSAMSSDSRGGARPPRGPRAGGRNYLLQIAGRLASRRSRAAYPGRCRAAGRSSAGTAPPCRVVVVARLPASPAMNVPMPRRREGASRSAPARHSRTRACRASWRSTPDSDQRASAYRTGCAAGDGLGAKPDRHSRRPCDRPAGQRSGSSWMFAMSASGKPNDACTSRTSPSA